MQRDMLISISRRVALLLVLWSLSIIIGSLLQLQATSSLPANCPIPHPSTILQGDRLFLGGRGCDEEMRMCDGTNEFWCERGGNCEEIVQGEVYRCRCPTGFAGDHCELRGAPCGGGGGGGMLFCYRGAECLVEGDTCDCPVQWRGSVDCSLPTNHSGSSADSSMILSSYHSGYSSVNGMMLAVFLVLCTGGAVWGVVKKKSSGTVGLQQPSQMSRYEMLEDDNDTELETIRDDNSHH